MAKSSTPPAPRPEPAPKPQERSANAPVYSCGHRALKAAVWRNESENGAFYNVTVTRSYKDGETWRESSSFGYDDMLIVAELLRTCYGFISREMAKATSSGEEARK